MMPVYQEPATVMRNNVLSQLESDYPQSLLTIFIIVEEKDRKTVEAAKQIGSEFKDVHIIIVPPNGENDWSEVIEKWSQHKNVEFDGDFNLPFGKGRALTYAYYSKYSTVRESEVITIFDAEDIVNKNLFKYAISGLEQGYDIVQGILRYRNGGNNLLSALESAEPVLWSNSIYPHTSNPSVPYQVLGPAYFFCSNLPEKIGGWNPYTTSEDVDFGFKAWSNGRRLGILDIYTDELGVLTLKSWFKQRRRWARGHQKALLSRYLKGKNGIETMSNIFYFYTYSMNSQLMSVTSIFGVPTGIYMIIQALLGFYESSNLFVTIIVLFNLVHWIYASYLLVKDTRNAYKFSNMKEMVKFFLRVNPISSLFYSMLWFVPVFAAIKDCLSETPIVWEKTPREGEA